MAVGVRHEERGRAPLTERVRVRLARRTSGVEAAQLAVFARLLCLRDDGYVEGLGDDDAAALVASAFGFFAAPGPELRVRAFAPTYAGEGWDAPVSVVETCMPDRPFVVDTIRQRLEAEGVVPRAFLHPILAARRDPSGRLELLAPPAGGEMRESFTHVAVPRTTDAAALARLEEVVRAGLEDVKLVTDDFGPMVVRARTIATELEALARSGRPEGAEAAGVAEWLRWLAAGAFVFLGYREYGLVAGDSATHVRLRPRTGLGCLRRESRSAFAEPQRMDALPPWLRARLERRRLFVVARTMAAAPVHRPVPMDDIGVQELDAAGRVVGERRFLGLFTSKAHAEEAAEVPLLRDLLRDVLAVEEAVPGSHDHKAIVALFNALPKTELLASTPDDVRAVVRAVLAAAGGDDVVVSLRARAESRSVSVVVAMPPERYSGTARERIRALVGERLGGPVLDDQLVLADPERALLHVAVAAPAPGPGAEEALQKAVAAVVRSWSDQLREALVARVGATEGGRLAARYARALPVEYCATVPPERAAAEVALLAAVERDGRLRVELANLDGRPTTALQLYLAGEPLVLSEFTPVLDNLGLRALAEDQVPLRLADGTRLALQTFHVQDRQGRRLDVDGVGARLADTVVALRTGRAENDPLNRLVLEAGLDWRAVHCLRAYAAFAVQAGIGARPVVTVALAGHPEPARLLFECFRARFRTDSDVEPGAARQRFLASLDAVGSLREDLVLRALLDVVEATVRTSFFARDPGTDRLVLKLRSADLAHLPSPRPLYEIWVHAPHVEGVHLRAGRIARGGIRHSDRPEDFRTEILGLMQTQSIKNAVIVPTGAKGGFVLKGETGPAAVRAGYEAFVRGLLDVTDNLIGGRAVHPPGLVVHDEEDPYLVVAADKGTAGFSDVANAIAAEYGFWLGDAFASGGSHGYDHKALGITARGVWECVRSHCRELGLDADTAPLTVVGIGDPSGDVFGNGSLRSRHLRLRAAFNHLHVFLDPDPDPTRSYAERERLFRAGAGWDSYDPAALSPGGAVVPRAAKRITLSPEAQAMLGLAEPVVSGERLVRAVLALDADLLFNGGLATYVAATGEPDVEVHDAVNDPVRVRASMLRVRVVAEGGNLGVTQRGRIEFALAGGHINTDAIDNSAGVDMSDHEVNLKICLGAAVEVGALTVAERNALLAEVTEEVAVRVLAHNRGQSRVLGLDQLRSRTRLEDFRGLVAELERLAGLDRGLAALPDRDALRARRGSFLGLTRPELAVVMAHTKIHLQHALRGSPVLDDPLLVPYLTGYFPAVVAERFPAALETHPLRPAILATEVVNALVDHCGTTFVLRVTRDTGVDAAAVVRAWAIAWAVVGGEGLAAAVADGQLPLEAETACLLGLERTSERVTKWVLANTGADRSAAEVATDLVVAAARIRPRLPQWLAGAEAEAYHRRLSELEIAGLPPILAQHLAAAEQLPGALDVVTVARETGVDAEAVAARYYGLGADIDFAWLGARLAEPVEEDRWQRRAVEGLADDLVRARRCLVERALRDGETAPSADRIAAVRELVRDVRAAARPSLAALEVVGREIRRLSEG